MFEPSKNLVQWIEINGKSQGFAELLAMVDNQRSMFAISALEQGDTDYDKGYVKALQWILELPKQILIADTETETAES